ncbi:MAG: hypothetical protein ACREE9_04490 [Stellaceae bacterium]
MIETPSSSRPAAPSAAPIFTFTITLCPHEEGRPPGPRFVITHKVSLDRGPEMDKAFRDKQDGCVKAVLKP